MCLEPHKLCEIGLKPPVGPPGGQKPGPGVSECLLPLKRPPGLYPATRSRATAQGSRPPGRGSLTWAIDTRHQVTGSQTPGHQARACNDKPGNGDQGHRPPGSGHLGAATWERPPGSGHQVTGRGPRPRSPGPRITANVCTYLGANNCERMYIPGSE